MYLDYVKYRFGLKDCSLDNLLWHVVWMIRQLTINIDSSTKSTASIPLYLFNSACLLGYLYVYVFCLGYNWGWVYPVTGDYLSIIINISLSFASNISTMKLIYMFILREKIMDIIDTYRAIDSTVQTSSRYERTLVGRLRSVKKRSLVFWSSFVGFSAIYLILPILSPGRNLPENSLTLYGLEPKDKTPNYEIAYTLVVLSGAMATFVPSNVTVLLIVLVGYIEAHVASLTKEYDMLWEDTIAYVNMINIREEKSTASNAFIKDRLNFLVSRHGEIVILLKRLSSLFEGIIAFEFALTMIALCAMLLGGLENTFLQLPYTIIQLVVDSLIGQRLLDAGLLFEKSVYTCGWENFDASNMKTLQVVLQCSQRPLRLTAGGITTLCFESFMSITKSVYSAYATLSNTM